MSDPCLKRRNEPLQKQLHEKGINIVRAAYETFTTADLPSLSAHYKKQ